jgi:ABC-type uncharacterized transport system ATPase subunit
MVCTKVVMVNRGRTIMTGTIDDVKRGRSLEEIFIDSLREDEETLVKVADVDEEVSAA